LKNIKELLNIEKILEPLINKKSSSKKVNVQNASIVQYGSTDNTPTVERAKVPILQMYARQDVHNDAAPNDSTTKTTESKFYPLVSSDAVVVDSIKYIRMLEWCKSIISTYGIKIGLTQDQINSYLSECEKDISSEQSIDVYNIHDIFAPIDRTIELVEELYNVVSNHSNHSLTYDLNENFDISKDKWNKASSNNLLEYYTYNVDISSMLYAVNNKLITDDNSNTNLDLSFAISSYEQCTSDYKTVNTSDILTTADIQSSNIENILLFSEYGITKIDEDIQNNTITIMSKKHPDKDIKINVAISARIITSK